MNAGSLPLSFSDLSRGLAVLRDLVRWREWYDSKLPMYVAAMAYAVLRHPEPGVAQAAKMGELLVLLCFYAAFGHIINDYADREADLAAGKNRPLARWSERSAVAAVALPAIATIGIGWACFDSSTLALTAVAVVAATVYSLPPARLKERGVLGWVAAVLAQRTLPMAIVFEALDGWDGAAAALTVLTTLIGLRFVIIHQLLDRGDDLRAGVRTVASEREPQRLIALLHRLFIIELAWACGAVAAMSFVLPPVGLAALAFALRIGPASLSPLAYASLYDFYCVIWPISLAVLLAARNPVFAPVVFVAAALAEHQLRRKFRAAVSQLMGKPGTDAKSRTEKVSAAGGRPRPIEAAAPPAAPATAVPDGAAGVTPSSSGVRAPSGAFGQRETMATKVQFDEADPYPVYAQLRGMAPVLRMDWPGLGRIWVVTRHREGLAVLKDPGFVRNVNPTAASGRTLPVRGFGRDMSELDPPDHTRLRRLVTKAFTPRMVQRFEARIAQLADQILDPAMSRGGIELISEYASVIPLTIITEMLGVPVGDIGKFRGFIYSLTLSQMFRRTNAELDSAKSRFITHLHGVFAARRQAPRDDLVSALVQVEQEGDRLSPDELIGMVYLLLVGGFEDMVNLIGNGILTLLRHPEQLEMLRQNPALADTAVDELLRFESPLKFSVFCCPTTDVDLGGVRIPRGAQIRVLIPSANRDEAQFAAPDALDITRDPCPHLSFGQGIHYCLGAPLARLEGRIAVSRLIERAPNLRLADPARMIWNKHPILRGLQQLPLRF